MAGIECVGQRPAGQIRLALDPRRGCTPVGGEARGDERFAVAHHAEEARSGVAGGEVVGQQGVMGGLLQPEGRAGGIGDRVHHPTEDGGMVGGICKERIEAVVGQA